MIPSPYRALVASFRRELTTIVRSGSDLYNPLIFFLSVIVFVPLGISPDDQVLAPIAPGMVWIIALLSVLLSLDKVFQTDFEDGCLEQMMLSGQSMYWVVITKSIAHWLATGLPLTLLSPVLALMLALPSEGYVALMLSLFFGTGEYNGIMIRDSNKPPLRTETVSAAPTAPIKHRLPVPKSNDNISAT